MTARLRYALAALAGAASMALTGATASVVMSALQTAVPSDSPIVTTAPETDDVPSTGAADEPIVVLPRVQVVAVDTGYVADVTDYAPPVDLTASDVVDLLPAVVRTYCELAPETGGVAQTCAIGDLLATAVTIAVPRADEAQVDR